jgi:hypothetical protein
VRRDRGGAAALGRRGACGTSPWRARRSARSAPGRARRTGAKGAGEGSMAHGGRPPWAPSAAPKGAAATAPRSRRRRPRASGDASLPRAGAPGSGPGGRRASGRRGACPGSDGRRREPEPAGGAYDTPPSRASGRARTARTGPPGRRSGRSERAETSSRAPHPCVAPGLPRRSRPDHDRGRVRPGSSVDRAVPEGAGGISPGAFVVRATGQPTRRRRREGGDGAASSGHAPATPSSPRCGRRPRAVTKFGGGRRKASIRDGL